MVQSLKSSFAFAFAGLLLSTASVSAAKPVKPDLADLVQGEYSGDVISDARGSSQSDVDFTIAKVAKNTVSIVSDYDRFPPRTFKLTKIMDTIQNVGGTEVFLLETQKSPARLSLTIDDAAWSGTWEGPLDPPEEPAEGQ